MLPSTPRSLSARHEKVTKLEIIVGRIRTLQKCPMKACVGNCNERKMRSKARPGHDQLCCGRPTARSPRDKNAGSTMGSATKLFCGTSIRTIGNDQDRPWFAIVF